MESAWLERHRNVIFSVIVLVAGGGLGAFYLSQPTPPPMEILPATTATPTATTTPTPTPTPSPLRVYITGAIHQPDVYFFEPGSIVKDLIAAAGGLTEDADPVRINQALELQDQQHIHVPTVGEQDGPPPVQGGSATAPLPLENGNGISTGRVNLNTASLEQLDTLPGVGPAIGQRIIDYREQYGGFKHIEEIQQVSGIGEATFNKISDEITIE